MNFCIKNLVCIKSYKDTSWFIYAFVSLLFLIKYLMRISLPMTIAGIVLFFGGIILINHRALRYSRLVLPILAIYTILALALVPALFPAGTFDVDRWDMINTFTHALLDGDYPYGAKGMTSGNNPAQSPFYFVLSYPFYLTNLYVGLPLTGIWVYWLSTRRFCDHNATSIYLLLFSPFIVYEILTCSTIFFNSALVAAWLLIMKYGKKRDTSFFVIHGIAGGMLLCTRNCYIIPVILLGMTLFLHSSRKHHAIIWGCSVIITFLLLYLPFIFGWGIESWMAVNPFKVQSEVILSFELMAGIIIVTIATGFFCKDVDSVIFWSGIWLFVVCVLMLLENTLKFGIETAYFNSLTDITYFILCIPFLMPFLDTKKNIASHDQ